MKKNNVESLTSKEIIFFKKVSFIDKYNFYEYLSVMLDGGVTITSSLESVEKKMKNPYFRKKIKELLVFLSSGDSLSKSMKKMPDIFSKQEVSIIESGENSGTLVNSLATLAEEFKKIHELRSKIKSSLTYPVIILIFLILAVLIVMMYVIPALIPLFEDSGQTLPLATTALIATSDFIANKFYLIILFVLFIILMIYGFKITDSGKRFFDELKLSSPLIGNVYKNYTIASVSSTLGVLIGGGVQINKSLLLVGKSTNNIIYEALFEDISKKVSEGRKIVDSIMEVDEYNEYFPSDFVQILSVGEKTASIDKVCKKLNSQYSREVDYSLANLTKWIEPLAILIAGIFVLWFAFAIFGAILQMTQTIG